MSTRKLLGDVRKEGGIRYSMSFPSLAQFSFHLCPGLNSATKFTKLTSFRNDLAKITKYRKWVIFRDVLAKTATFIIFTIFRQTLRQICQNSSPFVMLLLKSGAADFTILTEIAKFTNSTFLIVKTFREFVAIFLRSAYVKKNTSSRRRCRYVL